MTIVDYHNSKPQQFIFERRLIYYKSASELLGTEYYHKGQTPWTKPDGPGEPNDWKKAKTRQLEMFFARTLGNTAFVSPISTIKDAITDLIPTAFEKLLSPLGRFAPGMKIMENTRAQLGKIFTQESGLTDRVVNTGWLIPSVAKDAWTIAKTALTRGVGYVASVPFKLGEGAFGSTFTSFGAWMYRTGQKFEHALGGAGDSLQQLLTPQELAIIG